MPSQGITRIVRSRFESVVSLVIAGSDGAWLSDNRFHNVRDNALRLSRAPDAVVSGNLFSGTAPTNAIRLLDRSDDVRLTGNVLLGGRRAGILVASGSDGAVLAGNVIWARAGGAIKFLRAACGRAERNIVLDGAQKGIEVRASPGTAVRGNLIGGNHSSAIWISDQPQDALTRVEGNIIAGNGAGLATATAARIRLARNDFSAQLPRLVQGDILAQNRTLLADLAGATPIILTSAAATPARTPVATGCPGRGLR
jgi:nitrous oxidase accessory protein NosD